MNAPIKVLVVELNDLIRDSYTTFLQSDPAITVERLGTLVDARRELSRDGYDAILLDLTVAGCHGPDTVRELAQQFPDTAVIVITDDGEPEAQRALIEAGAHDFIIRGVALSFIEELVSKVRRAVVRNEVRPFNPARLDHSLTKTDDILNSLRCRAEAARTSTAGMSDPQILLPDAPPRKA